MKKLIVFLLILAAVMALTSCASQQISVSAMTIYYPYQNNMQNRSLAIGSETRIAEDADKLKAAVGALSGSPVNSSFKAIFNDDVKILSYTLEKDTINLYMSDAYADMALGAKAIARACLAMTLCGTSGIKSISIYVGDILDVKNLSNKDILIENTKLNPYETKIKLYFSNGTKLVPEYREISLGKEYPTAYYFIHELLKGPQSSALSSAIPAGTTLLSLTVNGGICTVNLSQEFVSSRPGTAQAATLAVYSIVNTLTSIPGINKVQLLINGEKLNSYQNININSPLGLREGLT
jgi:germination protein M